MALCLWFQFWAWSMTAIWGCFCVVGGLLMGPVRAMDFCWPVGGALRAVGWGGLGSLCAASKVEGLMGARALPSQVYPAGKLQWHFTCSFNFILILISISLIATWGHPCNLEATINGSCGNYGSLLVWGMALFGCWGEEVVGCVQSRELDARAPRLLKFILRGSFSDTLLVVSILDIDWFPFEAALQSWRG